MKLSNHIDIVCLTSRITSNHEKDAVVRKVYRRHFPIFISVSFPFYVSYLSTLAHVTSSILQSNHGERTEVILRYFSWCVYRGPEFHWKETSPDLRSKGENTPGPQYGGCSVRFPSEHLDQNIK